MTLLVTKAGPADAAVVEAILDDAAAWQIERNLDMWTPGQFGAEIAEAIADTTLYVARRDDAVVGCFILDRCGRRLEGWLIEHGRPPSRGRNIGRLAVAREAVGQGLGVELLGVARELARDGGFAMVWLECPAKDARLRRYHEEAGFEHIGDNDIPGPHGELWISSVYERSVDG
jgi:GNAT superfamily N-acetyltransferase